MAHIHRLVRQPYVYLSCPDLVADTYSSQTTKPNRGILAKLPLHGNFGELLFYHALQGDSSSDSVVWDKLSMVPAASDSDRRFSHATFEAAIRSQSSAMHGIGPALPPDDDQHAPDAAPHDAGTSAPPDGIPDASPMSPKAARAVARRAIDGNLVLFRTSKSYLSTIKTHLQQRHVLCQGKGAGNIIRERLPASTSSGAAKIIARNDIVYDIEKGMLTTGPAASSSAFVDRVAAAIHADSGGPATPATIDLDAAPHPLLTYNDIDAVYRVRHEPMLHGLCVEIENEPSGSSDFLCLRASPNRTIIANAVKVDPNSPSFRQAMSGSDASKWLEALRVEYEGLFATGAIQWERIPTNHRPLRSVLVLRIKFNADGSASRYKARICVDGSSQQEGEFSEAAAANASIHSLHSFCASAAETGADLEEGDFEQAYTHSPQPFLQYLKCPQGLDPEYNEDGIPPKVCVWSRLSTVTAVQPVCGRIISLAGSCNTRTATAVHSAAATPTRVSWFLVRTASTTPQVSKS
jgi:hypothetical protein